MIKIKGLSIRKTEPSEEQAPRSITPAATSTPARKRRSRKLRYIGEVENLDIIDQSEMHFDVVAVGRTPEMQRRLERAIESTGEPASLWLNKNVIAAIEGEEDAMRINSRGMVRGYSGKWLPNPKVCAFTHAAPTPSIAELLANNERELDCEIRMGTAFGGPDDGKVTDPEDLHRIACFTATRDILLSIAKNGAPSDGNTFMVTLAPKAADWVREQAGAGVVSPAAIIASHVERWQAVTQREDWSMEEEREKERELDAIQSGPPPFVVSPEIMARATKLAAFWEIDPNAALEELSWLEERMENPIEAGDPVEHFHDGDPERAKRILAKLAELIRALPVDKAGGSEARREVWARITQFGRLPWDTGENGWWGEPANHAKCIEAYLIAPTHQP